MLTLLCCSWYCCWVPFANGEGDWVLPATFNCYGNKSWINHSCFFQTMSVCWILSYLCVYSCKRHTAEIQTSSKELRTKQHRAAHAVFLFSWRCAGSPASGQGLALFGRDRSCHRAMRQPHSGWRASPRGVYQGSSSYKPLLFLRAIVIYGVSGGATVPGAGKKGTVPVGVGSILPVSSGEQGDALWGRNASVTWRSAEVLLGNMCVTLGGCFRLSLGWH